MPMMRPPSMLPPTMMMPPQMQNMPPHQPGFMPPPMPSTGIEGNQLVIPPPAEDEEPATKKARVETETDLVPEDRFVAQNRLPVTFRVQVPELPDKTEWQCQGQVLKICLPVTDQVINSFFLLPVFIRIHSILPMRLSETICVDFIMWDVNNAYTILEKMISLLLLLFLIFFVFFRFFFILLPVITHYEEYKCTMRSRLFSVIFQVFFV